jgi:hypothetical protein
MARPVWAPTDAQRRQAETMAAYGIPEADIARVLGVSKPTLRKHCGIELANRHSKTSAISHNYCTVHRVHLSARPRVASRLLPAAGRMTRQWRDGLWLAPPMAWRRTER